MNLILRRISPAFATSYALKIAWHILVLACLMWAIGSYLRAFESNGMSRHGAPLNVYTP